MATAHASPAASTTTATVGFRRLTTRRQQARMATIPLERSAWLDCNGMPMTSLLSSNLRASILRIATHTMRALPSRRLLQHHTHLRACHHHRRSRHPCHLSHPCHHLSQPFRPLRQAFRHHLSQPLRHAFRHLPHLNGHRPSPHYLLHRPLYRRSLRPSPSC